MAAAGLAGGEDSSHLFLKDTVAGGRFLNDQKLVALVADEAKDQIPYMQDRGVNFARDGDTLEVVRQPGVISGKYRRFEEIPRVPKYAPNLGNDLPGRPVED